MVDGGSWRARWRLVAWWHHDSSGQITKLKVWTEISITSLSQPPSERAIVCSRATASGRYISASSSHQYYHQHSFDHLHHLPPWCCLWWKDDDDDEHQGCTMCECVCWWYNCLGRPTPILSLGKQIYLVYYFSFSLAGSFLIVFLENLPLCADSISFCY